MMSIFFLILVFSLYIAGGTFAVCKVFPNSKPESIAIAFCISDVLGFLGVVLNGFIPPIPITSHDMVPFLIVLYLGLTGFNAFALMFSLEKQRLSFIPSFVLSAGVNLALIIILGIPSFYAVLSVSNLLFKA